MKLNMIPVPAYLKSLFMIAFLTLIMTTGCKKYLEIPLPTDKIAGEGAYSTDRSAGATLNYIFGVMSTNIHFQGPNGIAYFTGLYTDELVSLNTNYVKDNAFYKNELTEAYAGPLWTSLYQQIYNANLAIEGISAATTLSKKDQWLGEAYFIRALSYFYLTNYYGDVVLATSSNFVVNKDLPRAPKAEVHKLIIADLLKAQSLLSNEYKDAAGGVTDLKGRPNKFAATAFLAREYLYTADWTNAEIQATNLITSGRYTLLPSADIDKVFLAASAETIFNLVSIDYIKDYTAYNNNMPATLPYNSLAWNGVVVAMNPLLIESFETNTTAAATPADDLRKTFWTRASTMSASTTAPVIPAIKRYFPNKYKSSTIGTENIVLFRLAEQYLIRAEARARLNNLPAAKADLDVIRTRAGLSATAAASQTDLVNAVIKERRVELFAELGNRFFDLKRTGTIDEVMSIVAPLKGVGAVWNTQKQFFPIPAYDISVNHNLVQTPGY